MAPMPDQLWTIGHSTRSAEEFRKLLIAHGVQQVVDVRRYPASRQHPHFHAEALRSSLGSAGIRYEHCVALGGRRTPRPDSPNGGWRTAGFRGYADYMQTDIFRRALEHLMASSHVARTAIMCAEAVPWRCHRQLIADALVSRGLPVVHILSPHQAESHTITSFALMEGGGLVYPAPGRPLPLFASS
jgi:uncharacterized protein (DUF488 family)